MRVNPDSSADLLYSLAMTQREENSALQRISSGRRVTVPSDDPSAMAALIQTRSSQSMTDVFTRTASSVQSTLQMADSTLGSVVSGLERAITLGVEGSNSTQSNSDRNALATEVSGIRDNVLSLANVTLNGNHLFSGTVTGKQPFVLDSTQSSGVRYDGNTTCSSVVVGEGREMQVSVPGDRVFTSADGNVFESLQHLIDSLAAGNPESISSATAEVRGALDHVSSQRVFFGNALAQAEESETNLNKLKVQLSSRETDLAGADLAESISALLNTETARNAALNAAAEKSRTSLLDYLR